MTACMLAQLAFVFENDAEAHGGLVLTSEEKAERDRLLRISADLFARAENRGFRGGTGAAFAKQIEQLRAARARGSR